MTQHHGMGVMPWSPLKKGLLSGKYSRKGSTPHDSRRDAIAAAGGVADEQWRVIDELDTIAAELGVSSAGVAVNWVTRRAGVHSTLIGVRTFDSFKTAGYECEG
jgi:aryl-alcohol dehydrogenase-like predicted oxidoreductase